MKNKILIIEDNLDVRENLNELLTLSGYETITAINGKEGVQAALNQSPDLILCDIMMPELDGYGVLRILSKNPGTSSIPFIFMTAKTEVSDMRRGMTLGADDYVTKPFDDVELLDTIEVRLSKKRAAPSADSGIINFLNADQVITMMPDSFLDGEVRRVHKKELLYSEGQTCRNVYLVNEGRALGTKVDDYSKEVITRLYQKPSIIGLSSALVGQRFQETVRAFEELEVTPIKKEDFIQFMLSDKSVTYYFLSSIAKEQVKADEKLLLQAYSTVRAKLANVLIDLFKSYESDGVAVIPIPREDLASMAGTAKETIIRSLSEFKDEGLVSISGTDITIDDIQKLVDLRY